MNAPLDDAYFLSRIKALLTAAVANLDPTDRDERVAYCRDHDEHGVRMHVDPADDVLEFRWGGRTLAMVNAADLAGTAPLRAEFVASDLPDSVPEKWNP